MTQKMWGFLKKNVRDQKIQKSKKHTEYKVILREEIEQGRSQSNDNQLTKYKISRTMIREI